MTKAGKSLMVVGIVLFMLFILIRTNVTAAMFGLLLLVTGFINYAINCKKINYFLFAPLIYFIGFVFIYLQYSLDTFTWSINLFVIIIIFIMCIKLKKDFIYNR